MLRWATTVRLPNGERWLKDNPLHGLRRIREKNPIRPVASVERYEATRQAMRELAGQANSEAKRVRWIRMEFALYLAKTTGRRLSSIRSLKWEDFNVEKRFVRWRSLFDKKRKEWVTPLPKDIIGDVRSFQKRIGPHGPRLHA